MRSLAVPRDGTTRIRLVLYVTKGLADVVAAETAAVVPAAAILQQRDRFLVVALTVAEAARLGQQARTIEVRTVLDPGGANPFGPWSVTLSARGPVWRDPPGWDPAPVLARHFPGADLRATERSAVDLRVQADADTVHVALNLWSRPIGKRGGGGPARPGALRPTVAAALVRLAIRDVDPDVTRRGVYDPFCGTGAVVAEAAHLGLPVFASDIDERAVELARQRLAVRQSGSPPDAAALRHRVFTHDVRRGPSPRVSAGVVVGNMPWGQQVKVDGRLALFDATALLARHLLGNGGAAALLTTNEDPLVARLRGQRLEVSSRRIGLLGQTPAIVVARPG
jgi:hypothetical protein